MFNTIEEAIADIKIGKMVIVVDDEDRENEGDFIIPADKITPEAVNFMALYGRGLICTPLTKEIAKELSLNPMVEKNEDSMETAFTVSIDAASGVTTGISSADRSHTIKLLTQKSSTPQSFNRPGHIFPLIAKSGGVIERPGHTEAAIDLAKLAGCSPVGVICEILNDDGTCARVPDLKLVAQKFELKLITIKDLIEYIKNKG
jgi:3,4-dihydroxy 2-butanone 4-phosphate synthase/GTP cyclohydrolase II